MLSISVFSETAVLCVDDNLRFLKGETKKYDAFINHSPKRDGEKFYPAYVGRYLLVFNQH